MGVGWAGLTPPPGRSEPGTGCPYAGAKATEAAAPEAKSFRGLEVDDQLVLGRRLHRQGGRLLASEDAVNIIRCAPILVGHISPIRDQPPAAAKNRSQ